MKKIKYTLIGLVSSVVVLMIWGLIEPRLLNREDETAKIPNLPASWEGKTIAQVSDFQIGMWWGNPGTAHKSIETIVEEKPAAVVISGDFIYHAQPEAGPEIEESVSIVKPLIEAGIPTYAVLGNHDYGMSGKEEAVLGEMASELEVALEEAGVIVLDNETIVMQQTDEASNTPESISTELNTTDPVEPRSGVGQSSVVVNYEPLYLVAVDSRWADQAEVGTALSGIPDDSPRIALMHNPDSYEQFPANAAPLALAGHTHGGQMRIPFLPQWSWLKLVQKDEVYADGWAKGFGAPGNRLYVNPGIGMSIVPIRIFCPPEVTFFTLERGEVAGDEPAEESESSDNSGS